MGLNPQSFRCESSTPRGTNCFSQLPHFGHPRARESNTFVTCDLQALQRIVYKKAEPQPGHLPESGLRLPLNSNPGGCWRMNKERQLPFGTQMICLLCAGARGPWRGHPRGWPASVCVLKALPGNAPSRDSRLLFDQKGNGRHEGSAQAWEKSAGELLTIDLNKLLRTINSKFKIFEQLILRNEDLF